MSEKEEKLKKIREDARYDLDILVGKVMDVIEGYYEDASQEYRSSTLIKPLVAGKARMACCSVKSAELEELYDRFIEGVSEPTEVSDEEEELEKLKFKEEVLARIKETDPDVYEEAMDYVGQMTCEE